jgi:hypothetical protein
MAYNSEPRNLTQTAMWETDRAGLQAWATGRCLLEHLDPAEVDGLTKKVLIAEIQGALLRAEVAEDHRAAATDEVARPLAEIIG